VPSASQQKLLAQTNFACRAGLAFIEIRADTFGGIELHPATVIFSKAPGRPMCLCSAYLHLGSVDTTRKLIQREKEIL
jgi:hypothetical protein